MTVLVGINNCVLSYIVYPHGLYTCLNNYVIKKEADKNAILNSPVVMFRSDR